MGALNCKDRVASRFNNSTITLGFPSGWPFCVTDH